MHLRPLGHLSWWRGSFFTKAPNAQAPWPNPGDFRRFTPRLGTWRRLLPCSTMRPCGRWPFLLRTRTGNCPRDPSLAALRAARARLRILVEPDGSVGADCFVYFDASNPRRCLAPDAFVQLGVPKDLCESWKPGSAACPRRASRASAPATPRRSFPLARSSSAARRSARVSSSYSTSTRSLERASAPGIGSASSRPHRWPRPPRTPMVSPTFLGETA